MKKIRPVLILLIAMAVVSGCAIFGNDGDEPNFDLTSYPDTRETALSFFLDVDDALYTAFINNATENNDGTLAWTGSYGGGTVDVSGTVDSDIVQPGEDFTLELNNSYDNLFSSESSSTTNGTITGVTLTINSTSYKVTAEVHSSSSMNYYLDLTTGDTAEETTYTAEYNNLQLQFDFTAMIIRDGGMGSKIEISYDTGILSGSGITVNDQTDYVPIIDDIIAKLETTSFTMNVYKNEADATPTDIYSFTSEELFDFTELIQS